MKLVIGDYTIKTEDKYNFGLYKTVQKGTAFGKGGDGTTEKLVGYYGTLSGAINKLLNNELLEADDSLDLEKLMELITTVETRVNKAYNIRASEEVA